MSETEGEGCVDVDECRTNQIKCPHGQVCVNKEGHDGCEGECV